MNSSKSSSNSPLSSTELKSLQDNIDINKSNLEKGLKNRPNQYVLVDRGILLNPGKAYSDKMHQLDLAKKRDRLKKKIENRPDREELVRKLILQEESDDRKDEINRIKQLLDTSINTRPGSLELVDKNILQVDRLLASKVHNGDISYPKVCLDDIYFESNPIQQLPSISEIDIQTNLNDLSDIFSQSPAKSYSNKSAQMSYKKTCRVGRFSFHNIEFRPTAQKAREYQQNELLEYEKIQAQHDPSLKKVHSELTMKSRKVNQDSRTDKCRPSKYSLLHRLNVHELKSECKLRLISCSNIPKAQLVEKLLPYEAEVLRSHTSFDPSRTTQTNKIERRSNPMIQYNSDFSPPDLSTQSNLTPPPYPKVIEQQQTMGSYCNERILSKISHSFSEPIIQDCNNYSKTLSPIQFNFTNHPSIALYNNFPTYDHFNANNSYPLLQDELSCSQQSCSSLFPQEYSQQQIKPENTLFQSQPQIFWNTVPFNGFETKKEEHVKQQMSVPEHMLKPVLLIEDTSKDTSKMVTECSESFITLPAHIRIPSVPIECSEKFEVINKELMEFQNIVDQINHLKTHNSNQSVVNQFINEYKSVRSLLCNLCNEMIDLINMEIKFRRIEELTAYKQKEWLFDLLKLINNDFNGLKYENNLNERSHLSSLNDLIVNNGSAMIHQEASSLDDLDMIDFLNNDANKTPNHITNNTEFLKNEKVESIWDNHHRQCNGNELKTPETPFSEICYSPMSVDDLDHIMTSFLNSSDDLFL